MSEVTENSGLPVLTAGNTVDTLASVDRDVAAGAPSAADLDAVSVDQETEGDTSTPVSNTDAVEELLDEENTFDVNRAEFNELRDLVLSLRFGVEKYNAGASHKIPLVSVNETLGVR